MNLDLFDSREPNDRPQQPVAQHEFVLHGFAIPYVTELLPTLAAIRQAAPFRHLMTPGGVSMSVGLTNCGQLGWTSNRYGYRYTATDPDSGQPHGQRC